MEIASKRQPDLAKTLTKPAYQVSYPLPYTPHPSHLRRVFRGYDNVRLIPQFVCS